MIKTNCGYDYYYDDDYYYCDDDDDNSDDDVDYYYYYAQMRARSSSAFGFTSLVLSESRKCYLLSPAFVFVSLLLAT